MTLADDAKPTDVKKLSKTKCPLCACDAEFLPVSLVGTHRKFYCKKCKVFVVHKDDVERIATLPKSEKEEISISSNACSNDAVLVIHIADDTKKITHSCEPEYNWS